MDKEISIDLELTKHKLSRKQHLQDDITMIEQSKIAVEEIKNLTE